MRNSLILLSFLLIWSCSNEQDSNKIVDSVSGSNSIGLINDERILKAESEPGNWLAYGRTYEEQRFSPLTKINKTMSKI